jgi:hypothetical protein
MSTAGKVLLILGTIGGVCALLCCGGGAFFAWKFKDAMTSDPAKIRERTEAMIDIKIPEPLAPDRSINVGVMQFTNYAARQEGDFGILLFGELNRSLVQRDDMARQQLEVQMEQHMQQLAPGARAGKGVPSAHEEIPMTINGKPVKFELAEYAGSGTRPTMVKVTGFFWGKKGYVGLILECSRSLLTNDQIKEMLDSIK